MGSDNENQLSGEVVNRKQKKNQGVNRREEFPEKILVTI